MRVWDCPIDANYSGHPHHINLGVNSAGRRSIEGLTYPK